MSKKEINLLESSGAAEALQYASEIIPGSCFYFSPSIDTGVKAPEFTDKPGYVLLGREFERRSSRFKQIVPPSDINPQGEHVKLPGTETLQVGTIVIPAFNSNHGFLRLTSFENISNFQFDGENNIRNPWVKYSRSFMHLDLNLGKAGIKNGILDYIGCVRLIPEDDIPLVAARDAGETA